MRSRWVACWGCGGAAATRQGRLSGRGNLGALSLSPLTWGAGKFSTTLAIHSHCQRQVRQVTTREESQPDVLTSDLLLTRTSANTHQNGSLPTFPPLQSGATKTSLIGLGKGTISRHKTRDAMTDTWETPIECWQILLLSFIQGCPAFLPPLFFSLGWLIPPLLVSGLYLSFSFQSHSTHSLT